MRNLQSVDKHTPKKPMENNHMDQVKLIIPKLDLNNVIKQETNAIKTKFNINDFI